MTSLIHFLHYIIYLSHSNAYIYPYLTYQHHLSQDCATTTIRNFDSVDIPNLYKAFIHTYFPFGKNTFLLDFQSIANSADRTSVH